MNETNLLIDFAGEAADVAECRLDRVAFDIAFNYTKAEAMDIIHDHIFDHGDDSKILQLLAEFATQLGERRNDAIVFLKCAVTEVIDAQARIDAQKMIDDGMVGFDDPDGDA